MDEMTGAAGTPWTHPPRMIVGVSGATGIVYGHRLLLALRSTAVETHLVVSRAGEMTRDYETDLTAGDLRDAADHVWRINDVGAAISSGSSRRWAWWWRPARSEPCPRSPSASPRPC